ncbi:lysosome-associated membrane glycoprotein 3-like isoform X2 [Lytechinus variegatus]|uniref:lysosome-associated membrane glycoprotein 3-like isoform X2 n=1 Tax=Lytechinus variegatus TaxID=7654 RepID=UPI001BB19401|nr:lysosome-associated membrane glycoprotein 3-like isoform X2 [Lytechinus variegatus]
MARINIVFVVALLCGTEVSLATGITNTDGPTTTPISTTTGPTSTPTPTTTGPTTTTKPTTTKPTTTAAATTVNSTTEPTIATTSNMTTAISNMTTTISNMTTALSNMTTIISNMTTTTSMTTPSGGTTSAPKAQWQVKDEDGKLCILMNFGGTIMVTRSYTVKIPPDAHVSGNCSSPSHSAFFLYFSEGSGLSIQYWRFGLTFVIRGSSFELQKVEASWSTISSALSSSSSGKFFDVPVGSYYNCTEFNVRLSLFQLNLTQPSFQPFVKKTKGGDNMGDAYQCRPPSADSADLALIIGIAVGVVVVIIAAIVVTVYLVKRGKSPSARGYSKEP